MFKIAIALAATAAMGGVLFATEATAAQNAAGGHPGTARGANHASVARGNGGGRATVGRAHAGRVVGTGQVRGAHAGYRGGYGDRYAPAYGYVAPGYGYDAPAYGYDAAPAYGYDAAPAYGYDNGYGAGYAPAYAYRGGYGPVVPCVPAPIPVIGCY
jgi:hypothetical protein